MSDWLLRDVFGDSVPEEPTDDDLSRIGEAAANMIRSGITITAKEYVELTPMSRLALCAARDMIRDEELLMRLAFEVNPHMAIGMRNKKLLAEWWMNGVI